jgi:phosphoribosylamine---glycine ligase
LNVLLIGSGAREHALAWKLRQSPELTDLFIAPGNTGSASLGTNLDLPLADHQTIVGACRELRIDLVVVGNEEPLAAGLVDRLAVEGIAAFGPTKAAAEIEWSKAFAKRLMAERGIPTAPFHVFDDIDQARAFVAEQEVPLVVKADGLALGKGVVVTSNREQALDAVEAAMNAQAFGAAGDSVVIEARLSGREVSAHAFTDGRTVRHMPFSCDHKPAFNDDKGPNTGGMGAYSPAGWLDPAEADAIRDKVTEATINAMAQVGRPYCGVLYPGIMITDQGPMVIEFNSRFGDPETQVLLPRLQSDLVEIMWATVNNRLDQVDIAWSEQACIAVVLASGGYPGPHEKRLPISGLSDLDDGVLAFHAGVASDSDGSLVTAGGRVVTISALGDTVEEARAIAYRNVERVKFEGAHYRTDIGAAASPKALAGADKR